MSFHEVFDERASTVADVKAELRTVFSESCASQYDSQIDEKYKEVDGKLYQQQSGKGGNVTLKGVDIKFIAADDNKASFHATAHYTDRSDITEHLHWYMKMEIGKLANLAIPIFLRKCM